jgi:molecular chaperone HtpG
MLEIFRQKIIEVLFLKDSIEECSFQKLKDLNGNNMICIVKDNFEIDKTNVDKVTF